MGCVFRLPGRFLRFASVDRGALHPLRPVLRLFASALHFVPKFTVFELGHGIGGHVFKRLFLIVVPSGPQMQTLRAGGMKLAASEGEEWPLDDSTSLHARLSSVPRYIPFPATTKRDQNTAAGLPR